VDNIRNIVPTVGQWPDSASTDHGGVEGTHEHSYMKILRPSQHMEVLADREYPLSGTVRHRRAFGDLSDLLLGNIRSRLTPPWFEINPLFFARDVWMVMGHPSGSSAIDSADEKAGWDL